MTGDFYYCESCDLAYPNEDVDITEGERSYLITCSVCGSRVTMIDPEEVDLGIVDYLA
jgi:translation initiation factor 2 beta subunit (eIF-2beta)/eIF-5